MIRFERRPDIALNAAEWATGGFKAMYHIDYLAGFAKVASGEWGERDFLRSVFATDLWFLLRYGFEIEKADHPFVVRMCKAVQSGPRTDTLDIWARFHFKSSIITQGETFQFAVKNPDKCTGIFCYARPAAKKPLRSLKVLMEESDLLKWCFSDVLWQRPEVEAPKWSEDDGLVLKRKNASRKESSIEAHGLIEGMPTGSHFERCVFDDLETEDIRESPDMLAKVFSKFQMAAVNLGTGSDSDQTRVIGTYYSYFGPNVQIRDLEYPDGRKIYTLRLVPGSDDGTKTGTPVLMDVNSWEKAKMSRHFNSQQLCNPVPDMDIKLDFSMLRPIDPRFLPKDRLKFVIIDPAGDDANQKGGAANDDWAMVCLGVKPCMDDLGTSDIYIEDGFCDTFPQNTAIDAASRLYMRNGRITGLGVEKVGTDTTYIHIQNALRAQGRYVVIKKSEMTQGNLVLLNPDGKNKIRRIETSLSWPLSNGRIHYSTSLPSELIDKIREEMNKFPLHHVNFVDAVSYIYKLLAFMRFSFAQEDESDEEDYDDKPLHVHQGRSVVGGY